MEIELNIEYLSAPMAIVRLTKLQQILCGFLKMESGEIIRFKKNPRAEAVAELLRLLSAGYAVGL